MNSTSPFADRIPSILQLSQVERYWMSTTQTPCSFFTHSHLFQRGGLDLHNFQIFCEQPWNVLCERRGGSRCILFVAMNIQIEVSNSLPYHWCCLSNIFVPPPYIIPGSGVEPGWAVTSNKWPGQSFLAKYLTSRASIFLSSSMCFLNRQHMKYRNCRNTNLSPQTSHEGGLLISFESTKHFFPVPSCLPATSLQFQNSCLQF